MNYALIISIILSAIKAIHAHSCTYVNNSTESVVLRCSQMRGAASNDSCFDDLFTSNSKAINRLEVKHLKIDDKWCVNSNIEMDDIFANIHDLDLSFAVQSSILSMHDMKFKYLEKFNASNNKLELVQRWNLQDKPNLIEIDFSHNEIDRLPSDVFGNNTKLTMINLSHNSLLGLDSNTFTKLRELKVLDLSFNRIDTLHSDIFQRNTKLEILRMDVNPLKRFDCNWFATVNNLKTLKISFKFITELDMSCAKSLMYFDWNNANDVIIRLPTVETDFRFEKKNFKKLHYFNGNGNRFENISEILHLLGSNLRILDLSGNHLGSLGSMAFEEFVNLEVLKLSHTNLHSNSGSTLNLGLIAKQTFSSNSESTLENVSSPSNLTLSLAPLKQLKTLDISNNNLKTLNISSLSSTLNQLKSLNIANSQLQNIADLLNLLSPSIESLDLSQNFVGKISANTFRRFLNLQFLNLSHTHLSNFRFSTFYHQSKLQTLDLSYNDLGKVDFTLFTRRFNNLSTLSLEANNLTSISSVNLLNFPRLASLGISKNRFACSYLIDFLSRWPSLKVIENPSDGTHIDGIDCNENENNGEIGNDDGEYINEETSNKPIENASEVFNDNSSELRAIKYLLMFLCTMFCGYLIVKSNVISRLRRRLPRNAEGNVIYRQTTVNKQHYTGLIQSADCT